MKHTKEHDNQGQELQMFELAGVPMPVFAEDVQSATDLEYVLTNSAFGFEYALDALEKEGEFGVDHEGMLIEVEKHREAYFDARSKLAQLDRDRLSSLEKEIYIQKSLMFPKQKYLN